jgi:flagellar motility protein MotE (MotC chaperone)
MKFLGSGLGIAILAALAHVGTLVGVLLPGLGTALKEPAIKLPEKTALPPRIWSFKTEAVDLLITELQAERAKLTNERKDFVTLQNQTAAERAELDKVRAEIKALREEIDSRVVEIEERELKNLKTLAQTYAVMNPSQAVAIFREMEENMVVKVLAMMKTTVVGPILGEMAKAPDKPGTEPMAKRAARITDKLRLLKPLKKENA